jgi:hypothetical protein
LNTVLSVKTEHPVQDSYQKRNIWAQLWNIKNKRTMEEEEEETRHKSFAIIKYTTIEIHHRHWKLNSLTNATVDDAIRFVSKHTGFKHNINYQKEWKKE